MSNVAQYFMAIESTYVDVVTPSQTRSDGVLSEVNNFSPQKHCGKMWVCGWVTCLKVNMEKFYELGFSSFFDIVRKRTDRTEREKYL